VDDFALTFPNAGRVIVEDFPSVNLQMKTLGAPDTTMVLGNGIDETNAPIPFAMARRNKKDTVFAAVFEPYRTQSASHIDKIESLAVSPASPNANAIRILAPNNFADSILIIEDATRADRTFGAFTTDASVAYVRQDKSTKLQALVVANATKFVDATQSILASSAPITVPASCAGDALSIDGTNLPTAQLRVSAQNATRVMLNGNSLIARREQNDLVIDSR